MIALIILLFVFLLITALCFVKLRFYAVYSEKLTLKLKVLFFTFTLVPYKKKKKKSGKKKQEKKIPKKKKESKPKKKQDSYLKKLSSKKGVDGLFSILVDVAKLAASTMKKVFSKVVFDKFDVRVKVVGEDAADTALKYGKLCGGFYSAVAIVCETAKCEHYTLDVKPDFDDEAKMYVHADFDFYIRLFYVLKYALSALIKLLIIRYKR
ncbi:MAG: DUF2953 domain-containing protein [Ruminococcus sp.]|nr:DUF2953 domain-containing protein [Ruminococcus sp.]